MLLFTSSLTGDDLAALNDSFDDMSGQCSTVDHRLGGRLAARALLDHAHREIAVIAGFMAELADAGIANDEMALGALSYFHEAGIRVPQDVSVIGYDDAPAAAYSAPRLTSVHIPWREMTKNGIAELLNLCYGFNRPVTCTFPVSVSLRASLALSSLRDV